MLQTLPIAHDKVGHVAARSPTAPQPDERRRPLYISARLKTQMDVDGAALRARTAAGAVARYPLERVSRVIANACVDWSAAALRACMERGIPIVIAGGHGAPLGTVQPARVSASQLSADLEELLDRPDWREIYNNWLRATRMRTVSRRWAEREGEEQALSSDEFREAVRRFVYNVDHAVIFDEQTGIWRSALLALAATTLHRAGLQTMYWGAGPSVLRLLEDMTGLLELALRLEISGVMERSIADEAVALRVLHAMTPELEAQCGWALASLARRVKQVLSEWR
jgi:hypothetical protein